jgi:hypothetical protein
VRVRLIRFEDGTWGVRRGLFFHEYLDIQTGGSWHSKGHCWFNDWCKGTETRARKFFDAWRVGEVVVQA